MLRYSDVLLPQRMPVELFQPKRTIFLSWLVLKVYNELEFSYRAY